MYFFNFNVKNMILIIFLIVIPLILITLEPSRIENNFLFRSVFYATGKTQAIYHSAISSIRNTADIYLNLLQAKKTARQLKRENTKLNAQLFLLQEIRQENKRLNKLVKFREKKTLQFIVAKVTGHDPISEYHLVTINRGTDQGVKKNMIVINEIGFIGYVFRVHSHFSQIILLTDPHANIPVVVQRSRVHGVLEGANKNICKLKYLKRRDDIKKGDIVVTSQLGSSANAGFPVGTVSKVEKQEYGLTQDIEVIPFVNPSQLEEVLVITQSLSRENL